MSPRTPHNKRKVSLSHSRILTLVTFLFLTGRSYGQLAGNGNSGITTAANTVNGYFNIACTLLYAIGGIVGLIGAVKVFNAWNSGDPNTNKLAAAWFGSCVFLVVVATVLKSFFGVGA
ncbi:MAG TPA: DUF4134 domain-containing protein [Puia sp.]|uniref:DUF4134 domain-containing protein n=1 Tax=Puia sp. TaxID=2045100 RepID=UPI00092A3F07|nr:DUF4134 domain-containing protein [Puia sp.]MBN8852682.1 DUF4134 domain-containing protein [Sphingobacteriales bacterium]OJW55505.1 MAG: carbamoyl phosphate synthetase [Sphingobacteriales bacterium 50-39]HVU96807.1 DUF4134 domain-containing protein [Puia sp.]